MSIVLKNHGRLAGVNSGLNALIHHNIALFWKAAGSRKEMSSGGQTLAVFKARPRPLISDAVRDTVDTETLAACLE